MTYTETTKLVQLENEVVEVPTIEEVESYRENSIQQDLYEFALWQRDLRIESQSYSERG